MKWKNENTICLVDKTMCMRTWEANSRHHGVVGVGIADTFHKNVIIIYTICTRSRGPLVSMCVIHINWKVIIIQNSFDAYGMQPLTNVSFCSTNLSKYSFCFPISGKRSDISNTRRMERLLSKMWDKIIYLIEVKCMIVITVTWSQLMRKDWIFLYFVPLCVYVCSFVSSRFSLALWCHISRSHFVGRVIVVLNTLCCDIVTRISTSWCD